MSGVRRFRTFAWVGAIALGAGLAAYLARPAGRTALDVKRSSFRTTPDGVAAFARGLERFGRPTAPRLTPLADADPLPGALVLLSPAVVPSPVEVHALLERVRRGGTLVYAPQLFPAISSTLRITPLMDSLGIAFRVPRPGDLEEPEWAAHPLTDGLPGPAAPRRALRRMTSGELGERSVSPVQALLTVGRDRDRSWTGAGLIPFGEGHIIVLSDAEPLSNDRIADDPLAFVVMRAVLTHTAPADTIFFAEFHQGIRGYESTARRWADSSSARRGGGPSSNSSSPRFSRSHARGCASALRRRPRLRRTANEGLPSNTSPPSATCTRRREPGAPPPSSSWRGWPGAFGALHRGTLPRPGR